jgi:hypothetical protein
VHIFWQRRICAGDETTPYWFPSQTTGGSIREDRLVFPIPPGVHWRDAMPIVLPESKDEGGRRAELATARERLKDEKAKALPSARGRASASSFRLHPSSLRHDISSGGLRWPPPKPAEPEPKPEPAPKRKVRNDPKLVAAARELRDRYLEHVNAHLLTGEGKYDVSRRIGDEARPVTIGLPVANPAALPAPVPHAA